MQHRNAFSACIIHRLLKVGFNLCFSSKCIAALFCVIDQFGIVCRIRFVCKTDMRVGHMKQTDGSLQSDVKLRFDNLQFFHRQISMIIPS